MMELSDKEKKAIMHAIKCMMAADGVIDSNEMELLNKICLMMHVEQNEFDQVLTMSHEDAMSTLKDMSQDKRNMVALLLQDMAKADGLVDKTERMYFIKVNKELNFTNLKNI